MLNEHIFNVYNDIPSGIIIINQSQKIIFWNTSLQDLTGFRLKEMLGKECTSIQFFEDENKNDLLDFSACLKKGGELQRQTFIECKNGQVKRVFTSLRKIKRGAEHFYLISLTDLQPIIACDYYTGTSIAENASTSFQGIVGTHEKMKELYRLIRLSAESDASIIISGESGTGKELIANAIHTLSSRKEKPFIKVNCAALSESLLESELFGHVKGAFTGAISNKIGKFEAAHTGTLFLDEIGEISPAIQVKLLRVLQERIIERVGETKSRKIDIRLITATNKQMKTLVENGEFREDLYYRLNVFPLSLPSLTERRTDIPLLVAHFIEKERRKTGKKVVSVSNEALRVLMNYAWKGNIRELGNVIEYAFIVCGTTEIDLADLPSELRTEKESATLAIKPKRMQHSKQELLKSLEKFNGSRKLTAEYMGISTVALWKRMKKYELI